MALQICAEKDLACTNFSNYHLQAFCSNALYKANIDDIVPEAVN